ncbi:Cation channel sperm-associated protein 2 [Blastocladiella emersonii ATCC 22665]|nr:Cation channel sperm-associated protein 2 [Blastocladiella emersonii ATCC 22665]
MPPPAASASESRAVSPTPSNPTGETADDLMMGSELDYAFHDLASRSSVFRSRLIEEFQLLENLSLAGGATAPPQFNTRDVRDTSMFGKIMAENPHQLIKFQAFKRTQVDPVDRRLTRIRNKDKVPLGAWAGWVVESSYFQNGLLAVIIVNAIIVGIVAELSDTQQDHVGLFQAMEIIEKVSLFIFLLEIALRWTDNFNAYWTDAWNVFDFAVTIGTTAPELLDAAGLSSGGGNLTVIIRQLRTFRILRTLKLAVRFGSLRVIVVTVIEAFRTMALIMVLVLLVLFIFAVIGVYAFQPLTESILPLRYGKSFATLGSSLQVLFQFLTLDNWGDVLADMVQAVDPTVSVIYAIAWIFFGAFCLKNVIIGVLVSNFDRISRELREKHAERVKAKKMEQMRKRLKKELDIAKNNMKAASMSNLAGGDGSKAGTASRPGTSGGGSALGRGRSSVRVGLGSAVAGRHASVDVSRTLSSPRSSRPGSPTSGNGARGARSVSVPAQRTVSTDPVAEWNAAGSPPAGADDVLPQDGSGAGASQILVENIQTLLTQAHGVSKGWELTIRETLMALAVKSEETMWPRDTLFRYFQLMESLQENMREYQELQMMANAVLMELHD